MGCVRFLTLKIDPHRFGWTSIVYFYNYNGKIKFGPQPKAIFAYMCLKAMHLITLVCSSTQQLFNFFALFVKLFIKIASGISINFRAHFGAYKRQKKQNCIR